MLKYVIRRLLLAIVAVWGVVTAVFLSTQLSGNPAVLFVPEGATEAEIRHVSQVLGYDRPLVVQYVSFLREALTGHFPNSIVYDQPALSVVLSRMGATVELAVSALIVATALGMSLGYAAARTERRFVRHLPLWLISVIQATPAFYVGLLGVLLFGVKLRILPTGGGGSLRYLVMPALALGIATAPGLARVFRSSLVTVENEDFIRTARAKGVRRWRLVWNHLVPNALLPVITVLGMELGTLLGGAVIVEVVFSWPGVGRLAVQAISERDYPIVLAVVTVLAVGFVTINLVVDLLYAVLDPRIRLGSSRGGSGIRS